MSTELVEALVSRDHVTDSDLFTNLPRLDRRQVRLQERLSRSENPGKLLAPTLEPIGLALDFGTPEIHWRASGLKRPGLIASLSWPRRHARIGIGIETSLAHALVDRLLGFERFDGESHLQVTPVEFGILRFLFEQILDQIGAAPGPLGPWDLDLERLGADPFDSKALGSIVTIRWPVTIAGKRGSIRCWLSSGLIDAILSAPLAPIASRQLRSRTISRLSGTWIADVGTTTLSRGLSMLRVGGTLPIDGSPLRGSVASPLGRLRLKLRTSDLTYFFVAKIAALSSGGRIQLSSSLRREPSPREPIAVPPTLDPSSNPGSEIATSEVPVTLVVELGRLNLPISRLADLRPGDVLELGRHAREPVELTSGGRLVARGELVQIDTELGVRLTTIYL